MRSKRYVPQFTIKYGGHFVKSCSECPYFKDESTDYIRVHCTHPEVDCAWMDLEFNNNLLNVHKDCPLKEE